MACKGLLAKAPPASPKEDLPHAGPTHPPRLPPRTPTASNSPASSLLAAEPALFLVNPAGLLHVVVYSNASFARPDIKQIVQGELASAHWQGSCGMRSALQVARGRACRWMGGIPALLCSGKDRCMAAPDGRLLVFSVRRQEKGKRLCCAVPAAQASRWCRTGASPSVAPCPEGGGLCSWGSGSVGGVRGAAVDYHKRLGWGGRWCCSSPGGLRVAARGWA